MKGNEMRTPLAKGHKNDKAANRTSFLFFLGVLGVFARKGLRPFT
jgi:hypothetical protein